LANPILLLLLLLLLLLAGVASRARSHPLARRPLFGQEELVLREVTLAAERSSKKRKEDVYTV
jgi:hypothetical protein